MSLEGAVDLAVVSDREHVDAFALRGFHEAVRLDAAISGPVGVAVQLDSPPAQGASDRVALGVSPIHISPPAKYSFFQIGTVCFRVSMA